MAAARIVAPARVRKLWQAAVEARRRSYSPYSKFAVGAAIVADGRVVTGCNVENASYGGTICAERVACLKAVSEGCKRVSLVVVVANGARVVAPCGLCLQTLAEFCEAETEVWLGDSRALRARYLLKELLPVSFTSQDLNR